MSTRIEADKLYTSAEAAELLGLTERQVVRLRHAKKIACVRPTGAAVRHKGSQLLEFIDSVTEDAVR